MRRTADRGGAPGAARRDPEARPSDRGSAADDAAWRRILEYFSSATQIGLTATPRQLKVAEKAVDAYAHLAQDLGNTHTVSLAVRF